MTDTSSTELSFDEFDEQINPGPEVTEFDQIVDRAMSRRGFLGRGIALGTAAFVMGTTALTPVVARAASRLSSIQLACIEGYASSAMARRSPGEVRS